MDSKDTHGIDFMIKNPLCCFCENSYIKFFITWCSKKNDCRNLCAKNCEYYKPQISNNQKAAN